VKHLALAAMLVVACGRERDPAPQTITYTVGVDTAQATTAAAKAACPATGLWSECAVFERLDRAGLVPRRDSTAAAVTEEPLGARGVLLRVGTAELELYFYSDAAARASDEAKLDRTKYVEYAAPLSISSQATLIHTANLLAVLHSRNDHLRERVGDALTAGPPQPQTSR
jgi:hypothetical protein